MTFYVDDIQTDSNTQSLAARDPKESVRVATTANITLSGTQTIDGVSVIAGNRVLVKNQNTAADNGLYLCAAGAWTRSLDSDTSEKITSGCRTYIEEGTVNGKTQWMLTTVNPITLGSTGLTFELDIAAGTGLTKTKNSLAVNYGATGTTACVGNDSRLGDDRTASGLRTATTVVSVSAATAPIAGKVLTATGDSAATWQTPSGSADANAVHVNAASEISGITEKTAPVAADLLIIEDSAAANIKKRVQLGNLPRTSNEVTATGTITTTSASDVQMTTMTATPGAGTYLVLFSTSLSHSNAAGATYVSIYANTAQVAASERRLTYADIKQIGLIAPLATQAVVTVAAAQVIEVKWRTSTSTATAYQRTLTLLKLA